MKKKKNHINCLDFQFIVKYTYEELIILIFFKLINFNFVKLCTSNIDKNNRVVYY